MTINNQVIFGFNTKILKVSDKFVNLLNTKNLAKGSYMSLSIDAGSNDTYKKIHNIKSSAPILCFIAISNNTLGSPMSSPFKK